MIRGPNGRDLPLPDKNKIDRPLRPHAMYLDAAGIKTYSQNNPQHNLNFSAQDEAELEKKLRESGHANGGDGDDDDGRMVGSVINRGRGGQDDKPKVESFTGQGVSLGGSTQNQGPSDFDLALAEQYGDDPEMIAAIKSSMAEEESKQIIVPDEPPKDSDPDQITTLQLRCPDGSRLMRRFLRTNHVGDVINFYKLEKKVGLSTEVKIMTSFPKRVLEDATQTLAECGFGKQESLIIQA